MRIDVQAIVIGLDASARAAVQGAMRAIAASGDTNTARGRHRMLGEALDVLAAAEAHWTHGHAEGGVLREPEDARKHFVEVAHRARSRFDVEVIRNTGGAVTTQPAPVLSASNEPGVVLVTVVVAARREITDVARATDRASLRAGLDALRGIAEDELVAFEVVWSPAEDADRVSVAQLEARNPEIRRLES
ncbi:DUF1517 domain-containing protein [Sandaracinus amylolyticus]|uniref:Putative glycine rich membrane protein n=1 Tax=Sandaracinus amylolyticus TaxID=927083 RepID=A0A0F6W332_9BACT|nr:DUF1517 domain-containing protein [Sandaracinus amylolyticus]AKF06173.1 Putative glycine rich membrane protein [Sandaracinus amylolyticus]